MGVLDSIFSSIVDLPPWLIVAVVFALPAAEAGILIGVFVPGETAVLLGGVAASQGTLPLWTVLAAAVVGAVAGDQVGFYLGERFGPALIERIPARIWKPEHVERSIAVVRSRGAMAVLVGRWTAALRALVPGIAGLSGMSHRRFTIANVIGGGTWAIAVGVGGYLAGSSYRTLEHRFGTAGIALTVGVLAVVVLLVLVRRHAGRVRAREDRIG